MRPPRRGLAAGALGLGVLGLGGAVAAGVGGEEQPSAAATQATGTARIARRDLVEREEEDGTLGYADARTVTNRLSGTITWAPAAGALVRPGGRLFEVDGRAVYLLDGRYPAYRTLRAGLEGRDVAQLERNLRALGHDPGGAMTDDGAWDAGTTVAVARWQRATGQRPTGRIGLGRVVFQPGARRVRKVLLEPGQSASGGGGGGGGAAGGGSQPVAWTKPPGAAERDYSDLPDGTRTNGTSTTPTTTTPKDRPGDDAGDDRAPAQPRRSTPRPPARGRDDPSSPPRRPTARRDTGAAGTRGASAGGGQEVSSAVLTTTSTRRVVTVALDARKQGLARPAARVSVELPSGRIVPGRVTRVGRIAMRQKAQDGSSSTTVTVTIRLRTGAGTRLDRAPVDVSFARRRARRALTVPVTALLARAGGTLAVEVRERGKRRVVPVTTGLSADGRVQIRGRGLRPGMRVSDAGV